MMTTHVPDLLAQWRRAEPVAQIEQDLADVPGSLHLAIAPDDDDDPPTAIFRVLASGRYLRPLTKLGLAYLRAHPDRFAPDAG